MGLIDAVFTYGRIVGSQVAKETGAILLSVVGHSGFGESDEAGSGETAEGMPQFGALGVVGVPKKESKLKGRTAFVEALLARMGDGLVPVAVRDLRINNAAFPNGLAEAQTGIAGYGGGSVTFSTNANGESIATVYLPFQRNSAGVPQKAHAAILDPDQGITLAHADGYAVTMGDGGLVLRSDTGEARIVIKGDTVHITGQKVICQGVVVLGGEPAIAVPLLAGPASPPGPSVWISPT